MKAAPSFNVRDGDSARFIAAIESGDLTAIKKVPKADLHNHGTLGMRYRSFARVTGARSHIPPKRFAGLPGFLAWTKEAVRPYARDRSFARALFEAAIADAIEDGVGILEMSFDLQVGVGYGSPEAYASLASDLRCANAGRIRLKPEIGAKKDEDLAAHGAYIHALVRSGAFSSIDIYGLEIALHRLGRWESVYAAAGAQGMKLKAHLGEFQSSIGIRRAVERLGISAIQHGISISRSPRGLAWARETGIALNASPASNIALGAAKDWKSHPLRRLYDAGARVTIATDDLIAFGLSASEQYLTLYSEGAFTASELDAMRVMGLQEGLRNGA